MGGIDHVCIIICRAFQVLVDLQYSSTLTIKVVTVALLSGPPVPQHSTEAIEGPDHDIK